MATDLEQRICALVKQHYGVYILQEPDLKPEKDFDTDRLLDEVEVLELMGNFFVTFNVAWGNFSLATYYPPDPPLHQIVNSFSKRKVPVVPDFTIGMLIESARAGH
ncbi:hypothetical protein J2125_000063 [Erwinia toletana]|uniref:DUF1493 family protein n=1 Tax=Winslowiella toletana TaxID=92490 RepID=A0ABS4P462_9GAMM|nr:DUF1493 family protein [Winslowiella toletana]MBP2166871.1 hypothetical protein [Winslowiella toletana]